MQGGKPRAPNFFGFLGLKQLGPEFSRTAVVIGDEIAE